MPIDHSDDTWPEEMPEAAYNLAKSCSSAFGQIATQLAEHFGVKKGEMLFAVLSAAIETGVRCAVVLGDAKGMSKDESRASFLSSSGRIFDVAWDAWQSVKSTKETN